MNFWNFATMNYPEIAENESIDKNELLDMLEEIYIIGFDLGKSEGYDEGYTDCFDEHEIDD